jgi:uncharacterized protein YaeQ
MTLAQHPSESLERVLARIIAYCLEYESDLNFGRGLSTPDEPALWSKSMDDRILHWIDVGQPDPERLHKALKSAERASLYTYGKNADSWWHQHGSKFQKLQGLAVWQLDWKVLVDLAAAVERSIDLSFNRTGDELNLDLCGVIRDMKVISLKN